MSFKIIFSFFLLVVLIGCKQLEERQKKIIKTEPEIIIKKEEVTSKPSDEIEEDNSKYIFNREYTNQGFALIYNEVLFKEKKISKKIDLLLNCGEEFQNLEENYNFEEEY